MEGYQIVTRKNSHTVSSHKELVKFIADYPNAAIFNVSHQKGYVTQEQGPLTAKPEFFKKILKNLHAGKIKGNPDLKLLYSFDEKSCHVIEDITPNDNLDIYYNRGKNPFRPYVVNGKLAK